MKNKILNFEIIFSLIIICMTLIIGLSVFLKIRLNAIYSVKKQEALVLASNIIEDIKSRKYEDIKIYIDELSVYGVDKKIENLYQELYVHGDEIADVIFGNSIDAQFDVDIIIDSRDYEFDIAKDINVMVLNNGNVLADINTVMQRESIDNCNEPVISYEYFNEYKFENEYEIIPVKYYKDSFVVCSTSDKDWYNYYGKKWAKVLIFNEDNLKRLFIDDLGSVKTQIEYKGQVKYLSEYMYVWIPNFSMKDNNTYFRYGTSKNIIKMDFLYNKKDSLYLNSIGEECKDISETCNFDGVYGVWRKITDTQDTYYKVFNESRFGPLNINY